jgi:putative ABC transport system ATP-binding protein
MISSNSQDIVLKAEKLTKTWTTPAGPIDVLKGVDLDLRRGQSLAIIGPSGSGKSTLLSLLGTLDRPSSGTLVIGSTNIASLSDLELARWRGRSLGIIFQQFHLMPSLTALENVSLPLEIAGKEDARVKARQALAEVGLSARLDHLPGALSGGECQRVAIARAIVTTPTLLLADEPSGSLDPETGKQISDLIFSVAARHEMAMILVTHNMELAQRCQRILKMTNGRLEEQQTSN